MSKVDELIRLFDKGEFEKAILGEGDFMIGSHFWGVHDTLLVFYHLFEWIKSNGSSLVIYQVKQVFRKKMLSRKVSEIDNGLESIGLVRNYCIKANGASFWPIPKEFLTDLVNETVVQLTKEEYDALNVERDLILLQKYLPDLKTRHSA